MDGVRERPSRFGETCSHALSILVQLTLTISGPGTRFGAKPRCNFSSSANGRSRSKAAFARWMKKERERAEWVEVAGVEN